MLKLENIEAGYGKIQVLFDITLQVKEGEIVSLIGPNGSGKSTILKSIIGLVNVTKGSISFNEAIISHQNTHEIISIGISYVPQGRLVFQSLTIEENLKMGSYLLSKADSSKRLNNMYERFPLLKEKRKQQASFLSGGQQQLLSIARSLMLQPKLLLLDEPSLGLSPKAIQEVFQEIKKLNKEGISILLVEQNVHLALEVSDRIYVLQAGKVALTGGKELLKKKEIKDLYFGC